MSEPAPPAASAGGGGAGGGTAGSSRGRCRRAKNRRYRQNLKTRSRLQIACWNAEGLRRKLSELQGWLSDSHVDVLAVQEAQFRASGITEVPGFQTAAVFRRARGRRDSGPAKGGDVAVYVRKGLKFDKLETAPLARADTTTEWCGIRLFLSGTGDPTRRSPASHLDIHNIYRPPIRPGDEDQRTDNFDPSALPTTRDTLLLGDWNAHHPEWDPHAEEDDTGRLLADWMAQSGMVTLNDGSHTRTSY